MNPPSLDIKIAEGPLSLENLKKLLEEYCSLRLSTGREAEQERQSERLDIIVEERKKLEEQLGKGHPNINHLLMEIMLKRRDLYPTVELERECLEKAISIVASLPIITSDMVREDCIYRGTIFRHILPDTSHIPDSNEFVISDIGFDLEVPYAEFNPAKGFEGCVHYALHGFLYVPQEERPDAIMLEIPIQENQRWIGRHNNHFSIQREYSSHLKGVKIYRPLLEE